MIRTISRSREHHLFTHLHLPGDCGTREELVDHGYAVDPPAPNQKIGARAFHLPACAHPAEAGFMIAHEFAHLHPPSDGSLHMSLPPQIVQAVVDNGWAEYHPLAGKHGLAASIVMVYGPRDEAELEIVAALVRASHAGACRTDG